MKCLIIAAGRGSRLQLRGNSKPLIPVFGKPLIERVIQGARLAGAEEFCVVTGYRGKFVNAFLNTLAETENIPITTIDNPEWQRENGVSVLAAREHLREPFLLLMSDHIFDPAIARKVIDAPLADGEVNLGVDTNTENPRVNLEDATKVRVEDGKIRAIGKEIDGYNGFDTGIFVCTPAVFEALERSLAEHDDSSLSGGIRVLAAQDRANAVEIGGDRYWIDVDDPDAIRKAEDLLLERLQEQT